MKLVNLRLTLRLRIVINGNPPNSLAVGLRSVSTFVPRDILDQLDQEKPLANSVNLYSRHFSVSTGEYNWPSTVKDDVHYGPASNHPSFHLSQFVVDWAKVMKPNKNVVYTKWSHRSTLPCVHVYPDNVRITFNSSTQDQVKKFQSAWIFGEEEQLDFVTVEKIPKNTVHIYVCTHGARDQRCGVIGRLLIERFKDYETGTLQVFGCSHIGGHKFAGNMVIYRPEWKQGIWYGRVLPDDVEKIMQETVFNGKILGQHWRGGLPDGTWDPKQHMTAGDAEKIDANRCCQ